MTNPVIEALADLEHQQWAHWTRYMLENLTPENVKRWRRQIETPYSELTEKEKASDREWAVKSLQALKDNVTWPMEEAGLESFVDMSDISDDEMKPAFQAMIDTAMKEETDD